MTSNGVVYPWEMAAEALTANSGGADWRYFAAGGVSAGAFFTHAAAVM